MRISASYFQRLLHQTEADEALASFRSSWEARQLIKRADNVVVYPLSASEQVVLSVLEYAEAVTVGGHPEYFFRHRERTRVFGSLWLALGLVGLVGLRRPLAEALCLLPPGLLGEIENTSSLDRAMNERWEVERRLTALPTLDEQVWRAPEVSGELLRYLRRNEASLLLPERGLVIDDALTTATK